MKRVLLTVHKFFPDHRAGTEVLTLKVAQELQMRGYQVKIVTANPPDRDARYKEGPESSEFIYEGVPVTVVEEPLRLKENGFRSEYYNPNVGKFVGDVIDSFAPDLVHMFHAQNLSASVIEECIKRSKPIVVTATDFWFICPIVQLKRPNGAICRGPSSYAANCLTCYTPELFPPVEEFSQAFDQKYPSAGAFKEKLPTAISALADRALYSAYTVTKIPAAVSATVERPDFLKEALNSVSAITVATTLMKDLFVENGVKAGLIHHVPFGLDTAPLIAHQKKVPSKILRIGYIGTLYEHKGVDLLIRAFLELPENSQASLTIYGDVNQFPEYGASLKKLAEEGSVNSSKITFAGTFPNEKLGEVLSGIDVLTVPSRWYENTPLVIQSSLASKTPLIVTDLGGMSELVKHEVNGLVFELNNHLSLQKQILRLLKEEGLLQKLTDSIQPERTTQQMVDQLEAVYETARRRS
jgi:glycosyltransferase involved in cell wall biosynthesis